MTRDPEKQPQTKDPMPTVGVSAARSYFSDVARLLTQIAAEQVDLMAAELVAARRRGGVVYTFGNGGSASTAMHLANDLARVQRQDTPSLRTMCLSCNISTLTCLANDHGYEQIFAMQLDSLLRPGDVLLGVSASGNSPNCVEALKLGRDKGIKTLSLLGFDGGHMRQLSDVCTHIECHDYRRVEDVHMSVAHVLTELLEST